MTEIECIDVLKNLAFLSTEQEHEKCEKAIEVAIQALEEIQQYRAIGTVEEIKNAYGRGYNQGSIDRAEELQKCREYGYNKAIEEFKHKLLSCEVKDELWMMIPYEYIYKVAEDMKGVKE